MTRKKCFLITLVLSVFLIINPISVNALDTFRANSSRNEGNVIKLENDDDISNDDDDFSRDNDGDTTGGGEIDPNLCKNKGFLTDDAILLCHEILSYFRVLAPMLVIIFSAIDITQAVLGKYDGKEDALETAKIKVGKRLLACLILLFIPTILKIILYRVSDSIRISPECVDVINNGQR